MKPENQGKPLGYHKSSAAERICNSPIPLTKKSLNTIHVLYRNRLNLRLLQWIVFVSCIFEFSLGEASRPLNLAAIKGDELQLNCSTIETKKGYWKHRKPFENSQIIYFNKIVNGMKTLFSIDDTVKGHFNLLFNASEKTSGHYTCRPDLDAVDQSAEVIVLDAPPNCSMTVTSDFVNASCTINFNGNWAPEIQWHSKNGTLETNYTTTIPNSRVTSFLIVPLNQTDPGELDFLTCAPTFSLKSKPQETSATNVPVPLRNCTLTIGSPYVTSTQSTITITSVNTTTTPSPPLYIVAIVLCVGLTTFGALAIVVLIYRRKKRMRCSKNKGHSEDRGHGKESQQLPML